MFGFSNEEITGQTIPVDALEDKQLLILEEKLREAIDKDQAVYWIERYLLDKLYASNCFGLDRMQAISQAIDNGQWDITGLTQTACLGYKQFKRVFTEYFGVNPKTFLQITRFRKAFRALHTGSPSSLNDLAYDCGYFDKSHLIKDFKSFTGYTPGKLLSVCDPYQEGLSLFSSCFINGDKTI